MFLIAQNNFQLIIEFLILINIIIILFLNFVPLSLNFVLLITLLVSIGLTLLFGFDASSLLSSGLSYHEFVHPLGAIALLSVMTGIAAIYLMDYEGYKTRNLKIFTILLILIITFVGGVVHRDFLIMWGLGFVIGFFLLSKSFRRKSVLTIKNMVMVIIASLTAFGFFQFLSGILNSPIISPIVRLFRLDQYSAISITMVIQNTYLIGHNPLSSYWGAASAGFADGYISLPLTFITTLGLPFPEFYGILYNRKDVIDYFVPGIMGYSYDFGYFIMFIFLLYFVVVVLIGLRILKTYRKQREQGNKSLLGREALLIGSLTAFASQAWIGFFIINRYVNGTSLVEFLLIGALVLGHLFLIRRK